MAKAKKGLRVFLVVLSVMMAVLAIAVTVAGQMLKTMANTYLGKGKPSIVEVEGSEEWDTDYYSPSFAGDKAGATANGERITKLLCDEGFVLLKNRESALPLDPSATTVSLIGRGAADPLYGGSGSGNVDTASAVSPYAGVKQAGFTMDDASYNYFNAEKSKYARCSIKMDDYNGSQWLIGEVAYNDQSGAEKPFAVAAGNVAVYVISRAGGEGWDLSNNLKRDAAASTTFASAVSSGTGKAEYDTYREDQHQLELSQYEKNWLSFCKNNYAKTVVVVNSSNAMELGELESDDGVDAILWVGGPGSTGFDSLGDILAGKVNPSGRTADLYAADFTADPTFVNAGYAVRYTDIGAGEVAAGNESTAEAYTTQYEEGIYLGYRYYETRFTDESDYRKAVVYPFGYGLSYTTFEKSAVWTEHGDSVTVSVTVKNTGNAAGKEVVQLYYSAPYTEGGIEKAAVALGDFAKTKELKPGESDTVTLTVEKKDMASYDYRGIKVPGGGYVLEKGEYVFSIRENSHEVSDGAGMTQKFTLASDVLYTDDSAVDDGDMLLEKKAARNRFNDVSAMFKEPNTAGYASVMSRADFAGSFPTAPDEADQLAKQISLTYVDGEGKTVTRTVAEMLAVFNASEELIDGEAEMPATGRENGLVLSNMRGLAYNDPLWETYLDQLTEEDYAKANAVLVNGAYNTAAIASLGKSPTTDYDGPQGFSTLMGGIGACAYCSEVVIASTWNKDLAHEMGTAVGEESLANDIQGWYGPAMNVHRSPFAGRNFEYYSEDPVLTGKIACEVVEGAADKGCYAYIKHFALNDTEVMRTTNLCTWADEQTIREIYLKPFQIVVEGAKTEMKYIADAEGTVATREMPACTAVMSSFNRIGGTWAGGSYALMTEILREEWGFRGLVISDFNLYDYMDSDQGVRAGTDLQLTWTDWKPNFADPSNVTTRQAIRTAYKNMCYTVANSNRMQGVAPGSVIVYGLAWWQIAIIVFDVFAGLLVLGCIAYYAAGRMKKKQAAPPEEKTE